MNDRDLQALLTAVCANPDDDLPRHAYADRCEELGLAARAEFVRLQLESAASPRGLCGGDTFLADHSLHCEDRARCGRLLDRHLELRERIADLQKTPNLKWWSSYGPSGLIQCTAWRRGFVLSLACRLGAWLENGKHVARHLQPVEGVLLKDRSPYRLANGDGWGWWSRKIDKGLPYHQTYPENVHSDIAVFLRGYTNVSGFLSYPTEEAAVEAMSDALVRWARPRLSPDADDDV